MDSEKIIAVAEEEASKKKKESIYEAKQEIASLRNELFVSYKTILILQQHGFLEMTVNNTDYTDEKWRVDY